MWWLNKFGVYSGPSVYFLLFTLTGYTVRADTSTGVYKFDSEVRGLSYQNQSGKINFVRKFARTGLPDYFADKIGPAESVLAAKSGSLLVNVGPPSAPCETEVCNNLAVAR